MWQLAKLLFTTPDVHHLFSFVSSLTTYPDVFCHARCGDSEWRCSFPVFPEVVQFAAMKTKLWNCVFVFGAVLLASNCLAQKVPVSMQAPASTNDDQTALRFSKSLADEIQLSSRFYLWTGKYLPSSGVRIMVRSIQVKLQNGDELGSAIFVEAEHPSSKDPGYYKVVAEQFWMIPKGDSVGDQTRGFLAEVDRALGL